MNGVDEVAALTRRREVAARLRASIGQWVAGTELATERCGGSEGLRRLRELRAAGWIIDERPMMSSDAWEYRLMGIGRDTRFPSLWEEA